VVVEGSFLEEATKIGVWMESEDQRINKRRIVYAPQPDHISSAPALISVVLGEDEEVAWQWTHYADGKSCVTGYTIVEKPAPHI
jgi:hypothetical protein